MSEKQAREICFVIMPMGGYFDLYYQKIFIPAIQDARLEPVRADSLFRAGTIISDIWNYTKLAKVILAELTGKNPNVLYELGLAHAIQKPAILVTQSIDDIPFDLRALRILEYNKDDPDWGEGLKNRITKSIMETLESPTKQILPAFLDVEGSSEKIRVSVEQKEFLELKQELGEVKRELFRNSRRSSMLRGLDSIHHEIFSLIEAKAPEKFVLNRLKQLGLPDKQAQEMYDDAYSQAELAWSMRQEGEWDSNRNSS